MTGKLLMNKYDKGKEPIAIVGIGCRFPGGVDSPNTFWQLLVNEVDAITEMPLNRADVTPFYSSISASPGKIATREGGFLENVDMFDASFFGISPREANYIDPQQRLLLEVAWEALEDAGQTLDNLKNSQTGVFIGMWANDYADMMYKSTNDINLYITTGGGRYAASGRLSFFFGFQGPSLTLDTACSSSLVTVHLACQSLREGELTMALAGGVNLILEPSISIGYSHAKMLSPDGRCKFGDAKANGYVRSEGAGLVVLKRLSQAIADQDPIYAVIRGSAVNNDGRSSELLVAPGIDSQATMLREAYRNAGVAPADVGYIEAHGTGTPVGDPVELQAIGRVISEGRSENHPCLIGSVKTNIGHTEAASGVAGLIKAALCLKHKTIPASLHFKDPNPKIPWEELPLSIQTKLTPWPEAQEPAIAAVNSFGITGTNAHIILAEAASIFPNEHAEQTVGPHLYPISAHTPKALRELAKSYKKTLAEENAPSLHDLCYTAGCHRAHHSERLALVAHSHQELLGQLEEYLQGQHQQEKFTEPDRTDEYAKVVFVFPGQGSQWLGMGRELVKENPVFREVLEQCERAMKPWVDWSLLQQLEVNDDSPSYRLNEIGVIQPTLFAIEVALAAVWRSWGVEPSAVIGHSMGEVAAAYISGALSLDDAARVICKRSQLMQRTSGMGAMAVIGLPFTEVEHVLSGYEDNLSIAVQNSPKSTVLSGDPATLESLMENLREQEVFCRLINVDVASHSPQMDPLQPELIEALNNIQPRTTTIPFYSTVTQEVCDGMSLDAEYWGKNLRQPVRFGDTIQRLLEDEHVIFIELSPHPILLTSIEETSKEANKPAHVFASLRRDQPESQTMLAELGSLYTLGYKVDWNKLYPNGGAVVSLPTYPWQREKYWFETSSVPLKQTRPGAHPLLGEYLQSATGVHIWETPVSTKLFPYLSDHQVRGAVVFPAAAYLEMALAAATEVYGSKPYQVKNISFREALFLPEENNQIIQLVLTPGTPDSAEFNFYSRFSQNDSPETWPWHASGSIEIGQEDSLPNNITFADLLGQQSSESYAEEFYSRVSGRGLDYGFNFQTITHLAQLKDGILAKIKLPDELVSLPTKYHLHPVLLDACLQTLLAALPELNQDTYLPTFLEKLQIHNAPNFHDEWWAYVVPTGEIAGVTGNFFLFHGDGQPILSAYGLQLQRLEAKQEDTSDLLYEIKWQESPIPYQEQNKSSHWLIFSDQQGVGSSLADYLKKHSQSCTLIFAGNAYRSVGPGSYELEPSQPSHFQQLFEDLVQESQPVYRVVYLWGLDEKEPAPAPSIADLKLLSLLYLVQAIARIETTDSHHLQLVTRGAQTVLSETEAVSVTQAPIWGMGAVIANELPNLHCTRFDLSPTPMEGEIELLERALQINDGEDQVALRYRQRYVARLKRVQLPAGKEAENPVREKFAEQQSFQVQVTSPGLLDHLSLKPVLRKSPKAGEVEIAVKATGLNFMNVMAVLGILPGYAGGVGPLGIECAGIVLRVGAGVSDLQKGDEVAAIAFDCLGTHAIADARLAVKKPSIMSFAEAASIPIAYVTAYYAFHELGRLQEKERVLIHSATGGVGLAAIQLAKRAGAEIFATAGSEKKREYLLGMGIQHVMDSRSLAFAEEVMQETHGEGIDMVLNSLSGNAIAKGLEILKPYGRFMEIGKRDIYQNSKVGLLPFQNNLSYFAIDLDKMSRERPDIVGKMLHDVFHLIETGEIPPLPVETFPVSKVSDAFRLMAQAKHIGKVVIVLEDPEAYFELPAGATAIHAQGSYLITGGLGDLGLTFAYWLAQQGARHIVLVGRSTPSDGAQRIIAELEASGVNVIPAQADVTNLDQLTGVFAQMEETLPPLKGVIHAAGLLADSTILQMDRDRFLLALAPKVMGAWNLHMLTADQPLDFFILFSSVAAFLGTPGQANYAAGNAFLDALARYRQAQNLPALSINWGPWSEIGLAAKETVRGERLTQQGLKSISPSQGLDPMSLLMAQEYSNLGVMSLDTGKWCAAQPAAARSSLFKDILN